jgi:hypothetical protein
MSLSPALLAECRAELAAFEQRTGLTVSKRLCERCNARVAMPKGRACRSCYHKATSERKLPCACGKPYYLKGKCRTCYNRAWNADPAHRAQKTATQRAYRDRINPNRLRRRVAA